nr:MAG: RNA-dependent RNA polymerase [Botourmiaviridae sp.]
MPRSDSQKAPVAKSNDSVQAIAEKLGFLVGSLRTLYPKIPPLPSFATMASIKDFCLRLSEEPENHPWGGLSRVLSKRAFQSLTHTLFLFRKVIPGKVDKQVLLTEYLKKISSSEGPAPEEMKNYFRSEIRKIFKEGWDRNYGKRVSGLVLPSNSTLEHSKREGGGRCSNSDLLIIRDMARGRVPFPRTKVRIEVIPEGVKSRIVTVSSVTQSCFKPLHEMIYSHLDKQGWLLRGDPKPRSFSSFCSGKDFISGDYSSATDNIKLDLYQFVLMEILSTGQFNECFKESCMTHSVSEIFSEDLNRVVTQKRGQLMGNFLSFPILCLINYLCYSYAGGKKSDVKINGDDIVFKGSPDLFEKWKECCKEAGLIVHIGKTMIDNRFFTINSCLFEGGNRKTRVVPFIRSKPLFNKCDTLAAVKGRYESLCPGFNGRIRRRLQTYFLQKNQKMVRHGQRSLTRGLGLRVPFEVLSRSGLVAWERFYLRCDSEPPIPTSSDNLYGTRMPQGFCSVSLEGKTAEEKKVLRLQSKAFGLACRLYAQTKVVRIDYSRELREGTCRFLNVSNKLKIGLKGLFTFKYGHWYRPPPRLFERVQVEKEIVPERAGLGWGREIDLDLF